MAYQGSSYILERGLVWLVIHMNPKGDITSVEDHDHWSGGRVPVEPNETQEQLFTRRAMNRGFIPFEIISFLQESKDRTLKLNSGATGKHPITQRQQP